MNEREYDLWAIMPRSTYLLLGVLTTDDPIGYPLAEAVELLHQLPSELVIEVAKPRLFKVRDDETGEYREVLEGGVKMTLPIQRFVRLQQVAISPVLTSERQSFMHTTVESGQGANLFIRDGDEWYHQQPSWARPERKKVEADDWDIERDGLLVSCGWELPSDK